ncbi:MAG: hypothetical protein WC050_02995 [Candidatus Paceibacterota bacterium]
MKMNTMVGPAVAVAFLVSAGFASAQVVTALSGVNVSSSPSTTISPGSNGATIGTITITGDATPASITSIPVTLTTSNGGTAANLSSCQLFNSGGSSLTTGGNVVVNPVSGINTFTLDTPLQVSSAIGTTTVSVRCNVASATPSGATFQFVAGAPMLTAALNVRIDTAPSVPAGSQNVTLANISLDATHSGSGVTLSGLPLTITAGNGGTTNNLSDCRIRNASSLDGSLTLGTSVNSGGATGMTLNAPFTLAGGTADMLALTCNVALTSPVGSTFTISVAPNTIPATIAGTGTTLTPTAAVAMGPNGLPPATSGTVIVSAPTDLGGVITPTPIPGTPNTGSGGTAFDAFIILALSALVALGGAAYMRYEVR